MLHVASFVCITVYLYCNSSKNVLNEQINIETSVSCWAVL